MITYFFNHFILSMQDMLDGESDSDDEDEDDSSEEEEEATPKKVTHCRF